MTMVLVSTCNRQGVLDGWRLMQSFPPKKARALNHIKFPKEKKEVADLYMHCWGP